MGAAAKQRHHFHFALGKALEDDGQFEESFKHYTEGANYPGALSTLTEDQWRGLGEEYLRAHREFPTSAPAHFS